MTVPEIQCQALRWRDEPPGVARCEREARYINSGGKFLCSLCDMVHVNHTSIRLSDVPMMLTLLAGIDHEQWAALWAPKIKELIWRKKPT